MSMTLGSSQRTEPDVQGQIALSRIELLRKKIDTDTYLYEGITRIAQVLSYEILDIPQGGSYNERQRKGRK